MDDLHVCQWQCVFVVLLSLAQISSQYDDLLVPPKFPDLLSSFAESLSSSESLRHVVSLMKKDVELCGCSEVTKVNWTEFNANIGSYLLPAGSELCSPMTDVSTHHPNVAAVSSGQGYRDKGLVIGLSLGFVAIVLLVVILLTVKKYTHIQAAWVAVKEKSFSLRTQKSDCQPALTSSRHRPVVVSVSDSVAYSDTASVSNVSCFSFSGKVRTILLPLKKQKDEANKSELPGYVFDYCTNLSQGKTNGRAGKGTEMSDSAHSLSAAGAPLVSVGQETKAGHAEKTNGKSLGDVIESEVIPDAAINRKAVRASVDSLAHVDNAAWSALPNNRQFPHDREDLVDQSNYHLFSYGTPLSGKTRSTRL